MVGVVSLTTESLGWAMRRIAPILTSRAREMRADMSIAEVRLWARLRGGRLGVRFVRQLAVGS